MTDDDLAARYEALRTAAVELFDYVRNDRPPAPYTAEWHELHRVLLESRPPATSDRPAPSPDPARYSLAFTDHREDGSSGPYELARLAADLRADLAGDHRPEAAPRTSTMTELRAMIISSLLHELAARLAPGPAVGTAETGRDLAEIAADFGTRLLNMTSAGD
ncbi:MAG TPA: hypothetical protein VNO31_14060 [Umezawaea sp.]|nr:hypothetical protein [Umezawaea sp.]